MNIITEVTLLCLVSALVESAAEGAADNTTSAHNKYVTLKDQRQLIETEQHFVSHLSEYTSVLESTIESVKTLLADVCLAQDLEKHLEASTLSVFQDSVFVFENLVKEQQFERDFSILTHNVEEHEKVLQKLQNSMDQQEETLQRLPGTADLEEFSMMLAKMWLVYEWTADELLTGQLVSEKTFDGFENAGLEPEHILDVVQALVKDKMFTAAIKLLGYLQESVGKSGRGNANITAQVDHLMNSLVETHDTMVEKIPAEYLISNPYVSLEKYGKFDPKKHLKLPAQRHVILPEIEDRVMEAATKSMLKLSPLCANGAQNLHKDPELKCFAKSSHHPYWTIQPQKFELLSKDPFVVQIHDLVRDEMMNTLKDSELKKMKRAVVINLENIEVPSDQRVSAQTKLENDQDESVKWVKTVELTTGLISKGLEAEQFRVANYATGGHFQPHFDAMFSDESLKKKVEETDDRGDRIVTFMFYLSDVELGGRTAFPMLDLTVEPIKGSGLFWYNLHPDNSFDYRMMHSGCPVVKGAKWISIQLLRIYPQMFRLKCPPQPDYVNWFYEEFGFDI